jgi:HPt (histidine-containing phosphotransfer) domain-containing protein
MNTPVREPEDAREALDVIREVGGEDLVRTILRTFVHYADAQLSRVDTLAQAGDAVEIARVAHSLKSSARQVGAFSFADACAAVEMAGAGARDPQGALAGVPAMRREYAGARRWLDAMAAAA